jgi:hypothetical protein
MKPECFYPLSKKKSRPIYVYVSHQGSAEQKTITGSVLGL